MRQAPLLLAAALLLCAAGVQADGTDAIAPIVQAWPARQAQHDAALEARVEAALKGLSLRQKVGQIVQPEIRAITPEQVREYAIGTILNGGGGWPGNDRAATPAQWKALSEQFQAAAQQATPGIPLIWGTDAVHGHNNVRGATLFPHNIGLGATRNAELVRDIGRATARAVRASGLHWTFAPTLAVVQDEKFKYVHFPALPPLLFDLEKDPGQFVNRAADPAYAGRLAEYASKMLDWRLGFAERTLTGYRATPEGLQVRAA